CREDAHGPVEEIDMTADNEQVRSTGASAQAAIQLRRGADSASRVEPGTGPVTGVNGRGSSVPAVRVVGVVKRFGAAVALDGAGAGGSGGDGVWAAGPERGGQDHAGAHSGDAAGAGWRPGGGFRPRRGG